MALLTRLFRDDQAAIAFTLDGRPCEGRAGDTVMAAVLLEADHLRVNEFSHGPRGGFCQMGACQDCWMRLESGESVRACTTPLVAGMRLVSGGEP